MRLKHQFAAGYMVLLALPVIAAASIYYVGMSGAVSEYSQIITEQSLRQAASHLSSTLSEIENMSEMVFYNNQLRRLLQDQAWDGFQAFEDMRIVYDLLEQISRHPNVGAVTLFVDPAVPFATGSAGVFPLTALSADGRVEELRRSGGVSGWFVSTTTSGNGTHVSHLLDIRDVVRVDVSLGYLVTEVRRGTIEEILSLVGTDGATFVLSRTGALIASGGDEELKNLDAAKLRSSRNAAEVPVHRAGWRLVHLSQSQRSIPGLSVVRRNSIALGAFLLLFGMFGAVVVSERVTGRINALTARVADAFTEPLKEPTHSAEHSARHDTGDEVAQLERSFVAMTRRIERLLEANHQFQAQNRAKELSLLQAQINPHFLYNVLDIINWMAVRAGNSEISKVAAKIGRFYRLGLQDGRETMSVAEELEHVRIYAGIQAHWLSDAVSVDFFLDKSIAQCTIVKLVLQPLVENAIVHGILESPTRRGRVVVEGVPADSDLELHVRDDAGRMDVAAMEEILHRGSCSGYGIYSVHERLQVRFGPEYGLRFAKRDGWSVSTIRVPQVAFDHSDYDSKTRYHEDKRYS